MNGTVIDIPGISVNVNPIYLEDSTDKAYIVTFKDEVGKEVSIEISFGKIISICKK